MKGTEVKRMLNIGSGVYNFGWLKQNGHLPEEIARENYAVTNIDPAYVRGMDRLDSQTAEEYVDLSIQEFVTSCNPEVKYDAMVSYRFLEHVELTNMFYVLHLIGQVLNSGALCYVVVPDYIALARLLIEMEKEENEDITSFVNKLLICNYEIVASPEDPHASIWTPKLAKVYLESEGYYKIDRIVTGLSFTRSTPVYMGVLFHRL